MINTKNFSVDEAESGVLISFPTPTGLKPRDNYILYFDAPVILPDNSGTTVTFQPSDGSYAILGAQTFTPKVFIQIKSLYEIQTQTLLRLTIKDTSNTLLYSDYMMVICSPESSYTLTGKILNTTNNINIGPNGGGIFQITGSNQSTSTILVGDTIKGPGIPIAENVTVKSIISGLVFELSKLIPSASDISGTYTLSRIYGCTDPAKIPKTSTITTYTILDYINNWTYKIRNQIIAKFVIDDINNNQDLVIFLPVKNTALLAKNDSPTPIPAVSVVKVGGRVIQDTVPVSDI